MENSSPRSMHFSAIKIDGDINNNKNETINGEIRERKKVIRVLLGYFNHNIL